MNWLHEYMGLSFGLSNRIKELFFREKMFEAESRENK